MRSTLAMLLVLLFGGAVVAMAAGGYGSTEDPLVTLSYITDVAVPEANAQIDSVFKEKQNAVNSEIATKMQQMRQELSSGIKQTGTVSQEVMDQVAAAAAAQVNGASGSAGTQWRSLTMTKGQSLAGTVGCQLILRKGSASCYSGMVNLSSGDTLSHGQAVAQNNLYLIGTDGCGFTATADCTVLVNGSATIQ